MNKTLVAIITLVLQFISINTSYAQTHGGFGWTVGSDWCNWTGTDCSTGGTLSSSTFMIAHRMERHSLVTGDGAVHLIVNSGTSGLQMYAQNPSGIWILQTLTYGGSSIFANTDASSTTDIAVLSPGSSGGQSALTLVFNDLGASAVEEAQLSWNGRVWSVVGFNRVVSVAGTTYTMPSYVAVNQATTALQGEYIAVMEAQSSKTKIAVLYNNNTGAGYVDTGLSIPNPFNPTNCNQYSAPGCTAQTTAEYMQQIEHAPRLVYLPPSASNQQVVGLLYEAYGSGGSTMQLYWEVLTANQSGQNPISWTVSNPVTPISVGPMPAVQNAVDNSGFSVVTMANSSSDVVGTQYLAYLAAVNSGSGPVTYIRTAAYNPSTGLWGDYQALTSTTSPPAYPPSYVKLTYVGAVTGGLRLFAFFDSYAAGSSVPFIAVETASVPFSSCTTACYSSASNLTTPAVQSGQSYSNPRIDAPEYVAAISYIPVWLQYQYDTNPPEPPFSLLSWSMPIVPPP